MSNVVKMNKSILDDRFLRVKDLQKIFVGLSAATFCNWVNLGIVTKYKINGSTFFRESDIIKLIENSRVS